MVSAAFIVPTLKVLFADKSCVVPLIVMVVALLAFNAIAAVLVAILVCKESLVLLCWYKVVYPEKPMLSVLFFLLLKVLQSADDKAPLFVRLAVGKLMVCVVPELVIPKSVPELPGANVCVFPVNPFTEMMPEPLKASGVHAGTEGVPVFTLKTLSVVLNINKPNAGKGMEFCWVVVIRGARKPLVELLTSNIALVSGKLPVSLIPIF